MSTFYWTDPPRTPRWAKSEPRIEERSCPRKQDSIPTASRRERGIQNILRFYWTFFLIEECCLRVLTTLIFCTCHLLVSFAIFFGVKTNFETKVFNRKKIMDVCEKNTILAWNIFQGPWNVKSDWAETNPRNHQIN